MPALDHRGTVAAAWYLANDDEALDHARLNIVSLTRLLAKREENVGLLLQSDANIDDVADLIGGLQWLGINFSTFKDGRSFSLGRLARSRYGFRGDLRAYGPFIPDQGAFLVRCGFTSFDVADDFDQAALRQSIVHFSHTYQRPHGAAASIVALRQAQAVRS